MEKSVACQTPERRAQFSVSVTKKKREGMKQKVFDIIQKEIGRNPAEIDPNKPIREQITLDSMQFVGLLARIELGLNIELPLSAMDVITLNEFLGAIEKTASAG
jgi:acyl carrier protein